MCGIFGQATDNPSKINSANIKILGMLNESRGRNSCGITLDGEIFHGLDKDKLFTDFIKGKSFNPVINPTVFGHTRAASVGAVNHYNSHPFGFGEYKGDFEFIGVHNGTLENHEELAKIHNIDEFPKYLDNNIEKHRQKIDSEVLLEIIYKNNNIKVLSEYNGKAALVWTNTKNPNIIYLYSGKSIEQQGYNNVVQAEERPMNVWVESKNNFYFSSIKEPLYIIGAKEEDVFQIEYNTVFKITNGNFAKAEKTTISRAQNYQNKCKYYDNKHAFNVWETEYTSRNDYKDLNRRNLPHSKNLFKEVNIYDDTPIKDIKSYGSKIYSNKLRYYRNGHLINGIYFNIDNYGFVFCGEDSISIYETVTKNIGVSFHYELGMFTKSKLDPKDSHVPFVSIASKEARPYYFIDGVMLKSMLDYNVLLNQKKHNINMLFPSDKLSYVSMYPVFDVRKNLDFKKQEILLEGDLFTGLVDGVCFEKEYNIVKGNLIETKIIHEIKSVEIKKKGHDLFTMNKLIHDLIKIENEIIKKELESIEKNVEFVDESSEIDVSEYLCEVTLESFCSIEEEIEVLEENIKNYKDHSYHGIIMNTVGDIKKLISEYISVKHVNK